MLALNYFRSVSVRSPLSASHHWRDRVALDKQDAAAYRAA